MQRFPRGIVKKTSLANLLAYFETPLFEDEPLRINPRLPDFDINMKFFTDGVTFFL